MLFLSSKCKIIHFKTDLAKANILIAYNCLQINLEAIVKHGANDLSGHNKFYSRLSSQQEWVSTLSYFEAFFINSILSFNRHGFQPMPIECQIQIGFSRKTIIINIENVQILAKANIFMNLICLQMNLEAHEKSKIFHVFMAIYVSIGMGFNPCQ